MAGSLLESRQQVEAKKSLIAVEVIHKAEKKYEFVKVAVEIEANRRKLNAILNKLTLQNVEKLSRQVRITRNDISLVVIVTQIYERALLEPIFSGIYAELCHHLTGALPGITVGNERITFKRVLLNKCQEEFERGEREGEKAYIVDGGERLRRKDEQEEEQNQARCRMLANIRLIGELFKKKMLTERIMHECIKRLLLGQHHNPNEEDILALCTLISIVGQIIDHHLGKPYMDSYFEKMTVLSDDVNLSPKVRFMLKDAVELRNNNWQHKREVGWPKDIAEIHREAVKKWKTQANLLAFGLGINSSMQREPQKKFTQRLSKSTSHWRTGYVHCCDCNTSPTHDTSNQVIQSEDI